MKLMAQLIIKLRKFRPNAVARVQYNKVSGNFGYIQKVKQAINLAQIHLKIKT